MQTMREDAETILREAVAAAQPGRLVREALAAYRPDGHERQRPFCAADRKTEVDFLIKFSKI